MNQIDLSNLLYLFLKLMSLLGIILYGVFAGVLVRQEQLMAHVLEESFEPVLRILVWLHLIATIAIFLLALVLL